MKKTYLFPRHLRRGVSTIYFLRSEAGRGYWLGTYSELIDTLAESSAYKGDGRDYYCCHEVRVSQSFGRAFLMEANLNHAQYKLTIENSLEGVKVSPWLRVDGHCACRTISGASIAVENRVAFIEKTPRILVNGEWLYGPKGDGGEDGENPANELYGFCPASREWCDAALREHGAILPEDEV